MSKKIKILILILFIILIAFLNFNLLKPQAIPKQNSSLTLSFPEVQENLDGNLVLEINDIKYQSKISGPISISDFMDKLKEEGKIDFKEKNYTGMGKFIEEINDIKNSGNKNWIYYVNNKKANIGISNYKINQGDIVSWKYEK